MAAGEGYGEVLPSANPYIGLCNTVIRICLPAIEHLFYNKMAEPDRSARIPTPMPRN